MATETDVLNGVTTYDQASNVIVVKDAKKHTTKFEYGAMSPKAPLARPSRILDPKVSELKRLWSETGATR